VPATLVRLLRFIEDASNTGWIGTCMMETLVHRKTVLLVDDDEWISNLLAELLREEGYFVLQASTAAKALELAAERAPDVIVLDLRLPDGSGVEVLRELRARVETAETPVLVVSGYLDALTGAMLSRREQRATEMMPKPLDLTAFFHQVERAARQEGVRHEQSTAP
jgi:DNA-binding response OmpR family regulator